MSEQNGRDTEARRDSSQGSGYFSAAGQAENTGCCLLCICLMCAGM